MQTSTLTARGYIQTLHFDQQVDRQIGRRVGRYVSLFACLYLTLALTNLAHAANKLEPANVPVPVADEFHFVVLGDAQFHDPAGFNRIIDQTRRLRPAFVIQVGDLITGYTDDLQQIKSEWARFADQIAPLAPIHYLPIPGNHDLNGGGKKPTKQIEKIFTDTWGALHYAFDYKNTLIIGLNTDSTEGVNRITGEQWKWLNATLKASKAEHKMVFMHRPPLLLHNAEALHNLFKNHGVSHVFYGHHHHYHYQVRDGVAYTMTNAAANSAHDQAEVGSFDHLLQVSVRGSEVDVAVIEADAIKAQDLVRPEDNYDLFSIGRDLLPKSAKLRKQRSIGNRTNFKFKIPLSNTSRRDVQVFVSCDSADNRWTLQPKVIAPINLRSNEKSSLEITASYAVNRKPESIPQCHFRAPFQTAHGMWIDFNKTVNALQ